MNTALRFGAADSGWFGSPVYAVMRLVESHPDHPDGIVGARRDIGFHVMSFGIVEERRIVREYRVANVGRNLEFAYRDRVSRAAEANRKLRKHATRTIDGLQSSIGLE